jgi:hypothetical protein
MVITNLFLHFYENVKKYYVNKNLIKYVYDYNNRNKNMKR